MSKVGKLSLKERLGYIEKDKGYVRVSTTSKATTANPKDVVGSVKAAMFYVSPIARALAADAMMDGALKYDPYNWRSKKITAMNYLHAAGRHIDLWIEGQEHAPDSGGHHLGHAIASLSILLDAQAHGCLIDDRPTSDAGVALTGIYAKVSQNEKRRRVAKAEAEKQKAVNLLTLMGVNVRGAKSGRTSGAKPNKAGHAKVKR